MTPDDLTLTVRGWRALLAVVDRGLDYRRSTLVALRPGDAIATDGHRLVQLPLPFDRHRDLAFEARDLLEWLPPDSDVRLTMSVVADDKYLAFKAHNRQGVLRIARRRPDERVADKAIDDITTRRPGTPTALLVNTHYLAELDRLVQAFGDVAMLGARMIAGPHPDAVAFTFHVLRPIEGEALYVVMRLREADEWKPRAPQPIDRDID